MTSVGKHERALLVAANLTTWADARYRRLYHWLDQNAVSAAKIVLDPHYRQLSTLSGSGATAGNFLQCITRLATDRRARAVDVFLHLHGQPGGLFFYEGLVDTAKLADQLEAAGLRRRLLYSTACYGASDASDFLRAAFRVASGALAVNANGPYEYPVQLVNWGLGQTYCRVEKAGNHPRFVAAFDGLARALGFEDVDSRKIIEGRVLTRITSEAD